MEKVRVNLGVPEIVAKRTARFLIDLDGYQVSLAKYSEDQPRDDHGRWTSGGSSDDSKYPPVSDPKARGPAVNAVQQAAVKAGLDTETLYDKIDGQVGRYTAEREAQQQEIVKEQLDKAIANGAERGEIAILMGGVYAAGKTSSLDKITDSSKFVTISADTMKEAMVEKGMTVTPPGLLPLEGSSLVHEESSKMSWDLAEQATARGYNVIWDFSMSSKNSIDARLQEMNEIHPGYRTIGVFVDSPISQCLSSAEYRYANGLANSPNTARFTDPTRITAFTDPTGAFSSTARASFEASKSSFDSWVLIDNTGFKGKVVATSSPDVVGSNGKLKL